MGDFHIVISNCNEKKKKFPYFISKLDLISNFIESRIEFQTGAPILVKDFFIFSVLKIFAEKLALIRG